MKDRRFVETTTPLIASIYTETDDRISALAAIQFQQSLWH
jgi:hypothetical protein